MVDISTSKGYESQPGRQEWVTVIECISAAGHKIPPYVIFKGQNLMTSWLPENRPPGWMFAANASGWTNNYHGMKWIKHFDVSTSETLPSPDEYRLLLCDGHDSHISADFVSFCIQNRIDLLLLPPHSSHLLQPLDVGVFAPLKHAISKQISRLLRSGIGRVQKVEWIERFIEAREQAITKDNIISGWRGAGLFPENMHRILCQLGDHSEEPTVATTPPPTSTPPAPFFSNSSPPDPATFHTTNQAFMTEISILNIATPVRTHIRRLSGIAERHQAQILLLEEEMKEIKAVNAKRKAREGGKRLVLKGTPVASTEDVERALRAAESTTKAKKNTQRKGSKKQVIPSEDEMEDSMDDDHDALQPLECEMLDCIEVAM